MTKIREIDNPIACVIASHMVPKSRSYGTTDSAAQTACHIRDLKSFSRVFETAGFCVLQNTNLSGQMLRQ